MRTDKAAPPPMQRIGGGLGRLIATALVIGAPLSVAAETPDNIDALRQRALDLVNQSRGEQGLAPLTLDATVTEAAQGHTDDMFRRDYYAHESPEGGTPRDRYLDAGGSEWKLVAENIARCEGCGPPATIETVEQLHQGWMNSPPHRKNILTPGLATFGFGLTIGGPEGLYADQSFAGPGQSQDLAADEEETALDPAQANERALTAVNTARHRQGASALQADPALLDAATALLPPPDQAEFSLAGDGDLLGALPEGSRTDWASLNVVAGACGGCGTTPSAADIRQFVSDWMNDPQYRASLLDPAVTNMGLAVQADGEGRKIGVLVLGRHR